MGEVVERMKAGRVEGVRVMRKERGEEKEMGDEVMGWGGIGGKWGGEEM